MKLLRSLSLLLVLALSACSANVSNYHDQGGALWHVGGELDVDSGGTLDVKSGGALKIAGTAVSATATELNLISGADRSVKVKKQTLTALTTSGGVLAWVNPTASSIIVTRLILDVTTQSSIGSTVDCGVGSSATAFNDSLIDGLNTGAAAGIFDNVSNAGSNGKAVKKLASGDYITCTQASGTVTGLVGSAYIHYYAQ